MRDAKAPHRTAKTVLASVPASSVPYAADSVNGKVIWLLYSNDSLKVQELFARIVIV